MRVIGTAGHVDHGKSTLIEALTGIHPDRLKEEREREMTIDLGFAWWTLPNGEEVGVIDVPGHRDFIANMLAGVGGIDAVLFVIAADEGVMPQTREHLAILDLLQIPAGLVALTKIDLVEDTDWLDLVEQDVLQILEGTALESADIVRVSAKAGDGLDVLQTSLEKVLATRPPRPDLGRPRLPVDRVFTMTGFGTVVTGTLADGYLRVGDEIEILPTGHRGRVRGLQTHKRKEDIAVPGSRTAVNISGLDINEVQRGQVVVHPDTFTATRRVDVRFRLLPDASHPLKHDDEVKFYLGAAEVLARVRLLGVKVLEPGERGWLQLEFRHPIVAARGDRYILRRPSPGETIGGGDVIDSHPENRHKRFADSVLQRLKDLAEGSSADVLLQALLSLGIAPLGEMGERANLDIDETLEAAQELLDKNLLLIWSSKTAKLSVDVVVTSGTYWQALKSRALKEVGEYHQSQPLRSGMPREELKSRLKLTSKNFNLLMEKIVDEEALSEAGSLVLILGHKVQFNSEQQLAVDGLLAQFDKSPYAPPTIKDSQTALGEEVYFALVDLGELLPVSSEVVFRVGAHEKMVADVRNLIETHGSLTVAQARDHFKTTRRYVLAFLEHLDSQGITKRAGDARVLK
ncbi:MAG: selenocysteine-specific translation elongation factor [Chloroflexi bacterium]|nr:selenocysteine-specific translation elongation factor [Chloroflexota bacterium]